MTFFGYIHSSHALPPVAAGMDVRSVREMTYLPHSSADMALPGPAHCALTSGGGTSELDSNPKAGLTSPAGLSSLRFLESVAA